MKPLSFTNSGFLPHFPSICQSQRIENREGPSSVDLRGTSKASEEPPRMGSPLQSGRSMKKMVMTRSRAHCTVIELLPVKNDKSTTHFDDQQDAPSTKLLGEMRGREANMSSKSTGLREPIPSLQLYM